MTIGNSYWKQALWELKKQGQSFARIHLSAVLALVLALLEIIREANEISVHSRLLPHRAGNVLILVITIGTILTAAYELRWNKRKISHQESEFLFYLEKTLGGLDKLLGAEDDDRGIVERLDQFTRSALNAFALTFSVSSKTHTGWMVKHPRERQVQLKLFSDGANYQENLEIPLPIDNWVVSDPEETGPAGVAYLRQTLVYVPKKQNKEAFPYRREEIGQKLRYGSHPPLVCWIPAPGKEDFQSVLCVPVSGYRSEDRDSKYGVLNFSVKQKDPYVPRDFVMAQCFGKLLGIANRWSEREKTKIIRTRRA